MPDPVITRFAPSPTGFLHVGGARTALFNWLYARRAGGKMRLRIEDTDRERSTDAAIAAILDGLSWLGLDWDGDVVYQFQRAGRHQEAAEKLLASGRAYYCYATQQELDTMREMARAMGQPPRYDGRWRDRPASEAPPGVKPVVRLKAARDGETVLDDKVQGRVAWANKDLDDLVLLRSDGTPTYMLAVVVDDHDMGITHIIRGDDHLTNAARQMQIYQALGWEVPVMAHIPLIHGADGTKLSKRHGALGVDAYRAMGYLPEALRNYLVRLGWSQGDKEFFSNREMIEAFDLAHVGRAPARFDFAKLESMNGHYIRNTSNEALVSALESALPYLLGGAGVRQKLDDTMREKLRTAMPGLKERAKTLIELLDGAKFLFADRPLVLDVKAASLLDVGGRAHVAGLIPRLAALKDWNAASLEAAVRGYSSEAAIKLGDAAQPLRAALTGRAASPGIFDVLEVLGREESLARLHDQAG
ncbi:MAG: glutamate--tRNA ligase [Methylocella sp.]